VTGLRGAGRRRNRLALVVCGALLATLGATPEPVYEVLYDVRILPDERVADVTIRVEQSQHLLRVVRLDLDGDRVDGFEGAGEIERRRDRLRWDVPASGGALHFRVRIDHLREPAEYDARCTRRWALLRGTDLVPPVHATLRKGSRSRSRIRFRLPAGWRIVTPFEEVEPHRFALDQPARSLDLPRGWMIAGHLDVLRAEIDGTRVVLAAPQDHDVPIHDRLALLRWTLPALHRLVGPGPASVLVLGAGDPMWRGGLSGPHSMYLHADRPLIEADGTSPLLHELVHVAMGANAGPDGDWIVEGLAELYAVELLRRSGTITADQAAESFERMRRRAEAAPRLLAEEAEGPVVDRAVVVLRALDERIRERTRGEAGLDEVLRRFVREGGRRAMTPAELQRQAEVVVGGSLDDFFAELLD
jgi:hypothetical protein